MINRRWIVIGGLLLSLKVVAPVVGADTLEKPNIVIVMVDDMGFSDIGCYGGEIPTPHLDALAANGLRFTQFLNTGRCCPTRASLLTGLYPHQVGVGHMTADRGHDSYRGALNDRCVTIGDVARSAGYRTILTGKWHVGYRERSMWPHARGFDDVYACPEGGGFYKELRKDRTIVRGAEVLYSVDQPVPDGWYVTDDFTAEGLAFIDGAIERGEPFLWYLAHIAPHFPLQADAEDIARFRTKYLSGWDVLSEERFERQVQMGLFAESMTPHPRPNKISAWEDVEEADRDRFDHIMAAYAACVWRMDRAMGDLVAGLRDRGVLDNTLILFLSDNGGNAESGPGGRTKGDPTEADSDWFCGESWAWMQNTPFRRYKHYNHEGGIATPLIAHWPVGIADRGAWRTNAGHVIDLMATVVDLTGATYPHEVAGRPILPMEGISLVPAFESRPSPERSLYFEHEGNAAVRRGDWKLVRKGGKGAWQLYDLAADRGETTNLADSQPERVSRMAAEWQRWAKRCGVHPTGLPPKAGSD